MAMLKCNITAGNLVGAADKVVEGVLAAVFVPRNLPAGFTFQVEEVVDGYAHILYTFSTPTSPFKYPLQRQSYGQTGAVTGSFETELVGGHLQIRASAGVVGTFSLLVL